MDLSGQWIDRAHQHRKLTKLVLGMDSSVSETYGHQHGSAFNGHCGCSCYHPLFVFNQFGDLERVMLRRGNHHSAKFWRRVLIPVIARYRDLKIPKFFRGDAAFASPKLFRLLEEESYWYAIRLKANTVLARTIAHPLKRSVGRPSKKPKVFYHNFRYRPRSRTARSAFIWEIPARYQTRTVADGKLRSHFSQLVRRCRDAGR